LKHYAPDVETYLIKIHDEFRVEESKDFHLDFSSSVLIDYGDIHKEYSDLFLRYLNLSEKGIMKEAMSNLYTLLREAEMTDKAEFVVISSLDIF